MQEIIFIIAGLLFLFIFFKFMKLVGKLLLLALFVTGCLFFWHKLHPETFHQFILTVKGLWK